MFQKHSCLGKDGNNVSGQGCKSCPFYDEIDAILGNRAASEPQIVLQSGTATETGTATRPEIESAGNPFEEEEREEAVPLQDNLIEELQSGIIVLFLNLNSDYVYIV